MVQLPTYLLVVEIGNKEDIGLRVKLDCELPFEHGNTLYLQWKHFHCANAVKLSKFFIGSLGILISLLKNIC